MLSVHHLSDWYLDPEELNGKKCWCLKDKIPSQKSSTEIISDTSKSFSASCMSSRMPRSVFWCLELQTAASEFLVITCSCSYWGRFGFLWQTCLRGIAQQWQSVPVSLPQGFSGILRRPLTSPGGKLEIFFPIFRCLSFGCSQDTPEENSFGKKIPYVVGVFWIFLEGSLKEEMFPCVCFLSPSTCWSSAGCPVINVTNRTAGNNVGAPNKCTFAQ